MHQHCTNHNKLMAHAVPGMKWHLLVFTPLRRLLHLSSSTALHSPMRSGGQQSFVVVDLYHLGSVLPL